MSPASIVSERTPAMGTVLVSKGPLVNMRSTNKQDAHTSSYRFCFDHANPGRRRHNALECEAARLEELVVFHFGALHAAGQHHHGQIEELAQRRLVAGWDYPLGQEQLAVLAHRLPAILQ